MHADSKADCVKRITHLAQRNARHNQQALAHWITTKTAPEILAANNARRLLKRKYEVKHGVTPLVDPRKPKRGLTAYFQYLNASFADRPEGEPIIAHARRIGRLWATMPAAEKKPYEDMAHRDAERYNAEYTAVFGPRKVKKVKARSMGVQTE